MVAIPNEIPLSIRPQRFVDLNLKPARLLTVYCWPFAGRREARTVDRHATADIIVQPNRGRSQENNMVPPKGYIDLQATERSRSRKGPIFILSHKSAQSPVRTTHKKKKNKECAMARRAEVMPSRRVGNHTYLRFLGFDAWMRAGRETG